MAAAAIGVIAVAASIDLSLLGVLVVLLSGAVVVRLIQGRLDVFEPLIIFVGCWTVMFLIRPIAMVTTGNFDELTYSARGGFTLMLAMAVIGAAGFMFGYALPAGRNIGERLRPLPGYWRSGPITMYSLGVVTLGLLLFGLFISNSGGLDAVRSLLSGREGGRFAPGVDSLWATSTSYLSGALVMSLPGALLLIAAGRASGNRLMRSLGYLIIAAAMVGLAPSGMRGGLLVFLAGPLTYYYLRRSKRPSLVLLAFILPIAFVAITFTRNARDVVTRQNVGTAALLAQSASDVVTSWNDFVLGGDTEMAGLLSLEASIVPSRLPFSYGAATGELFVHAVPRQVWPDKPRPGDEILTRLLFVDTGISTAPRTFTPMGNFYMDFGYPGVLVGMALLGMLGRAHYAYFVRNASNAGVQLFYAATLFYWLILFRGNLSDTAGRLFFIVPALVLGMYLARRRGDRRTAAESVSWSKQNMQEA